MATTDKSDVSESFNVQRGEWTVMRGKWVGKGRTKGRAFLNMLNNQKREERKEDEETRKAEVNRKRK